MIPALSRSVYGKPLVYFDNAATSQRPKTVIDRWNGLTQYSNSNIHRAVHLLSSEATDAYENARDAVKDFINAPSRTNIVFTSGTTNSINLAAFCLGECYIKEGDEIIISEAEHHSNLVSWQLMCKRKKANIVKWPVEDNGSLDLAKLSKLINVNTKLVAVTHVSNVLGIISPVKEICSLCHSSGIPVFVDGAQGIVHSKVDVQDIDCDFYVFSGHKMYAATGTGVLYAKQHWLESFPPYMGGGEMVGNVSFKETTFAPVPMKFEAGTQNFNSIPTFNEAIEFLRLLDTIDTNPVKEYLMQYLLSDKRIKLYGIPQSEEEKIPLFSFSVVGSHHEDLALILDKMGIATRSGQMCAEPLMDRFGVTGMLRISLAPYNTMEEAEYFVKSLQRAIKMLI